MKKKLKSDLIADIENMLMIDILEQKKVELLRCMELSIKNSVIELKSNDDIDKWLEYKGINENCFQDTGIPDLISSLINEYIQKIKI